jgi:hypothetical protein
MRQLEKGKNFVTGLEKLIQEQVTLIKKGKDDTVRLEQLSRQADLLTREIAQMKILDEPDMQDSKKELRKAFETLALAISAEQKQITEDLKRLRKASKTIGAYKQNL